MAYEHQNSGGWVGFFSVLAGGLIYIRTANFRARAGLDMRRPRNVLLIMVAAVLIPACLYGTRPDAPDPSSYGTNVGVCVLAGAFVVGFVYLVWLLVMGIWCNLLRHRLTPQQLNRAVRWHYVTMEEAITNRDWNMQQYYNLVPGAVMMGGAALFGATPLLGFGAVSNGTSAANYRAEAYRWNAMANQIHMGNHPTVEDLPSIRSAHMIRWLLLIVAIVCVAAPAVFA